MSRLDLIGYALKITALSIWHGGREGVEFYGPKDRIAGHYGVSLGALTLHIWIKPPHRRWGVESIPYDGVNLYIGAGRWFGLGWSETVAWDFIEGDEE